MSKQKKESYFWTSFSDLMTSLFFVMLVLFVLTIAILHKKMVDIEGDRRATEEQLEKITEIEEAVNRIDTVYFAYNNIFKKHILRINVNFPIGQHSMIHIDNHTKAQLERAGKNIAKTLQNIGKEYPGIQYLLIIEGQASKDNFPDNYGLSYRRALALNNFWREKSIDFGNNCEVLISGSGTGGTMRDREERLNQRFLIHILPKPGIIEASKKTSQ